MYSHRCPYYQAFQWNQRGQLLPEKKRKTFKCESHIVQFQSFVIAGFRKGIPILAPIIWITNVGMMKSPWLYSPCTTISTTIPLGITYFLHMFDNGSNFLSSAKFSKLLLVFDSLVFCKILGRYYMHADWHTFWPGGPWAPDCPVFPVSPWWKHKEQYSRTYILLFFINN